MIKKNIAIALSIGALSLTGCSIAPTSQKAAGPAPAEAASATSATVGASAPSSTGRAPATTASKAAEAKAVAAKAKAAAQKAAAEKKAAAAQNAAAAQAAPVVNAKPVTAAPAPAAAAPASAAPAAAPAKVAPAAAPVAPAATGSGHQAAAVRGWGPVIAGDEFSNTGSPDRTKWSVYNGPGHAGKGVRSPQAWSVANGVATVRGDAAGTTGGMSAKFGNQKYGKWETRMKTDARDPQYHPVLILWPDNDDSKCAEIDYAEGTADTAQMKFFLHYACGGGDFQTTAAKPVDTTQWHNYAVEWTPAGITGYIDGVKTFTDTNPAHQPSGSMHQTLQLDWFPNGSSTAPSQMQVDWVRVYK
ncbi:glycoside hydrolase family 16 protein [Arthrobacter sp. ZGTC131]|uniref:glycoside hydrolase family 16 protein n=1 Tax=Arthrobacter sp. ZGTC131 TaxID=2058898 RepID=UPI0021579CF2|nr:glycoside hydrolase family 16 protein [Arthrobacter sp. ZGTC131]